MLLKFIDDKIRRAFSDAAVQYDVLTGLHKEIGRELLAKAAAHEGNGPILDVGMVPIPTFILDVGMGTGWLTSRLKNYFPDARVVGIDFAAGMVDVAKMREKDCAILQADARHMPFKENTFEMIASNLAYQWVGDLPKAFANCHAILKSEGKLHLTMFGYSTFRELFEALEKTRDAAKGGIALKRLADRGQVSDALITAGFRDVSVEEEHINVHFQDMLALVKWIKDIGANALVGDMFIGRDWLNRANAYYAQTFADQWGVGATFEVIWVEAKK
jgi:malonyl-CoA O-methyltransferase